LVRAHGGCLGIESR